MPRSEIGRLLKLFMLAVYRERVVSELLSSGQYNNQALRHVFRVMDAARHLVSAVSTARNCLRGT